MMFFQSARFVFVHIVLVVSAMGTACSVRPVFYFNEPMKLFRQVMQDIHPELRGSIVAISGREGDNVYTSVDVMRESQFYIGSIAKQMTALMLFEVLKKQHPLGDLSALLKQKLLEAFPFSEILKDVNKPWVSEVSLLDLLTHQSGLSGYIAFYEYELKKREALNEPIDPIILLKCVTFDASKKYQYSDTNYFLLAKLIEEALQINFEIAFCNLIKGPEKMDTAHAPISGNYWALKQEKRFEQLASNLNEAVFIDMANALGAGNVVASFMDLLRWNRYLHVDLPFEVRHVMLESYCYNDQDGLVNIGLETIATQQGSLIAFEGEVDSYRSYLAYLKDYDLHIVVLSNNAASFDQVMLAIKQCTGSPLD